MGDTTDTDDEYDTEEAVEQLVSLLTTIRENQNMLSGQLVELTEALTEHPEITPPEIETGTDTEDLRTPDDELHSFY